MAYSLGFTEIEPFRQALKSGDVPAPNEYLAGKPVWYRQDLEARYGTGTFEGLREGESSLLQHIEVAL
ncbi:MAG: hypothetical protein ACR2RF_17110 [Geminicoccaceae bacterium]